MQPANDTMDQSILQYSAPQYTWCGYNNCAALMMEDGGHRNLFQHLCDVHGFKPPVVTPPPSITCKIGACTSVIYLHPEFSILWEHVTSTHGYPQTESHESTCQWEGCDVDGRPWKGQNVFDHIISEHLGFTEHVCMACGGGPYANAYSLRRHQEGNCHGRSSARCRRCLHEFPSIHALLGHMELGLCRPFVY
jgi:hypothetical protein